MLAIEAAGYLTAKGRVVLGAPVHGGLDRSFTMKYEPKLPRKPCDWPTCGRIVVVTRSFCQDRKCQDARFHARKGFVEATPDELAALAKHAERKATAHRKAYEYNKIYLRAYRRLRRKHRTQTERQVFLENSKLRQALLEEALTMATGELRTLIEEQLAEPKDRIKRGKGDPWGMLSLDATLPGTDNLTLADLIAGDDVEVRF